MKQTIYEDKNDILGNESLTLEVQSRGPLSREEIINYLRTLASQMELEDGGAK